MATNSFWIGYHFEEFRSQVAIRKKNSRPVSVLRECWEADFCYLVRVEARGRTISTRGGVGGGYRGKCYWLKEFLLDHTNFFERFFWLTIFLSKFLSWAVLLSCECETALCVDSISLLNLFIILLSLINVLYQGWYLQTKENLVFNIMHGKFWFDGDFSVRQRGAPPVPVAFIN